MDNRSLFHATMRKENGDKLLRMELAFNIYGPTWKQEGLPEYVPAQYGFPELTATPSLFDHFQTSGFLFMHFFQFCEPGFETKVLEEKDNRRIYTDRNGATWQERMDTGMGIPNGSIPHEIDFTIKSRKAYEENRFRLTGNIKERVDYEKLNRVAKPYSEQRDLIPALWVHGPFAYMRELMGTELAMLMPYDEPEMVHMMLKDHLEKSMACAEPIIKAMHPDISYVWEDCSGGSGPFMSPSIFIEFMAPWYRGWKDFLTQMGVPYMLVDSDGDVTAMVGPWHESGVDIMLPWEVNGVDMMKVAEQYPNLAMMGGLYKHMFEPGHPSQAGRFPSNDVHAAIDAELARVIPAMKKRGRYFPAMDHAVNEGTHYQDYAYYVAQVDEKYGGSNCSERKAAWDNGSKMLPHVVE